MKKAINLYKKVGESPLDAINRFKEKNAFYKKKKTSYAGRLDPLAEGVLLVLVGDETKKINQYLGFDKEYKAEILIGVSSDSHDILGIPYNSLINNSEIDKEEGNKQASKDGQTIESRYKNGNLVDTEDEKGLINNERDKEKVQRVSELDYQAESLSSNIKNSEIIKEIKKKIKSLKGIYVQKIPAFSSYKIKGKPMFYYALKGQELKEIKKTVKIKKILINSIYEIKALRLLKIILNKIDKVNGDFRQSQIKECWKKLLMNFNKTDKGFLVFDITVVCSSGTYIRAIADEIGKNFRGGLLLSLERIRVGKFNVRDSLRI